MTLYKYFSPCITPVAVFFVGGRGNVNIRAYLYEITGAFPILPLPLPLAPSSAACVRQPPEQHICFFMNNTLLRFDNYLSLS
jgi:hypothetical protein